MEILTLYRAAQHLLQSRNASIHGVSRVRQHRPEIGLGAPESKTWSVQGHSLADINSCTEHSYWHVLQRWMEQRSDDLLDSSRTCQKREDMIKSLIRSADLKSNFPQDSSTKDWKSVSGGWQTRLSSAEAKGLEKVSFIRIWVRVGTWNCSWNLFCSWSLAKRWKWSLPRTAPLRYVHRRMQ